ncbi:hypothetical protein BC332_15178 [Capsicum chinense]|nr:hypothetical protein BC332_15178 [Capsicum chinense]
MISSQLFAPTKANLQKSFHQQFLPLSAPDVVPSEQVELDFSDAFDPPPCLASNETSNGMTENVMFLADMSELVYDDTEIVHSRSHSLVGLSSYKNQVLIFVLISWLEMIRKETFSAGQKKYVSTGRRLQASMKLS